MGFYDSVKYSTPCPKCGNEVTGFQTKDLGEGMNTYQIHDLWNGCIIYSDCDNCKNEITLRVKHVTPPVIDVQLIVHEPPTQQEIDEYNGFIEDIKSYGGE